MYKIGDKVRIIKERKGGVCNEDGKMDKWLGRIMTIKEVTDGKNYKMIEDDGQWYWCPDMIEELVKPQKFDYDMIMQEGNVVAIENKKQYKKLAKWADNMGLRLGDGTRYTNIFKFNYAMGILLDFNKGHWGYLVFGDLKDEKVLTYKQVKLNKEKIETKEDTLEWSPKDNEDYWYTLTSGAVRRTFSINSEIDKTIIALGRAYPTKECAELATQMDEIDKKYTWIKNYIARNDDGWRADWDNTEQDKCTVHYDYLAKKWHGYSRTYIRNNEVHMSFEMQQKLLKILNKGE